MTSTVAVFPAYNFKRFDNNIFLIKGHTGNVTDCDFSPYNDNLLATASEDGSTKLWIIPTTGLTDHLKNADATLVGHTRKVMGIACHKPADNILATHGADMTVRIWDIEQQANFITFNGLGNIATAMKWSPKGDKLGIITKGGNILHFDPRVEGSVATGIAHTGAKAQKISFVDDDLFITSGFNKQAEREYAMWDCRQME